MAKLSSNYGVNRTFSGFDFGALDNVVRCCQRFQAYKVSDGEYTRLLGTLSEADFPLGHPGLL